MTKREARISMLARAAAELLYCASDTDLPACGSHSAEGVSDYCDPNCRDCQQLQGALMDISNSLHGQWLRLKRRTL